MSTYNHLIRRGLAAFATLLLSTAASSQGPAFESPGMPTYATTGQTTRFSREFNPAIGFVIDTFADYVDDDAADGFDASFRLLELNASAFVDPNAWAYVALVSEGGESPEVEEAAIEYVGMSGNRTLRAGRFFVDFGKQMQNHLEELRTLERPLPLREYLGEELSGVGVQYDDWFALDDETPVRFSIGAFASLLGEGHHEEEGGEPETEGFVPDRKDVDELSFTARLTGMTDVGESGVLQLGSSLRLVPEFAFRFEDAGLEANGLSNAVYGFDATYQHASNTGIERLTFGGELLLFDGDLAGELDDPVAPTAIDVVDDSATGFYVWGDYGWDQYNSAGIQYALADLAEDPSADASEIDLYYTRHFTEYRRLRFGVTIGEDDGEDANSVYVQFTSFFGNHAHGLNW